MDPLWMFLFAAQALLTSCAHSSSHFLSEPLSTVQKQGGAVLLRCLPRQPSARLSWLFQGRPLEAGSAGGGAHLRPASLTLPTLQPHQTGHYQCVLHTEAGAVVSRLARVSISEISQFGESRRRAVTVAQGGTAIFECRMPNSNPPALPRLRVRGEWLEQSTGDYLILPSGNLQIPSVSPEHQGTYKCGAFNPVTRETRLEDHGTRLTVQTEAGAPSPVRIMYPSAQQTLAAVESEDLTLECVLSRSPPPSVRWTKDGQDVKLGSGRRLLLSNLVLTGVSRHDEGFYQCHAGTEAEGVLSANYTVIVREPVSVLQGLTDQSTSTGSSVVFSCVAKGNPAPNVTWLFNSAPVTPSKRLTISGPSLHISDITAKDQGIYQCLFDNGIGSAQSAAVLKVLSGVSSNPEIWSPPSSGSFHEGDYVSLSCNASGQPPPVIRWYNTAGPITTHPSRILQPQKASSRDSADGTPYLTVSWPGSSSLYIQAVTLAQAGEYVCEASNDMGAVRAEAFVSVVPLLSATLASTTDSPGSSILIQNDEGKELLEEEEEESNYGLDTPAEKGSDLPTPEAPIITSPPQTRKHDIYDLEWRPGKDWGHPINAYFVRYRKLDDAGNVAGAWHTVRVPGSEKSLRLSDLEPSSLYEVLMVARSVAGDGQPAMLTFRTARERSVVSNKSPSKAPYLAAPEKTPEHENSNTHFGVVIHDRVPGAPDRPTVSMATENSVYVTWIPRANGGSPITAFRVEYRRQVRGSEWAVAADNISPLKLSVEVASLEPGSTYRFRVIALNMYGESHHSAPSRPYQVSPANPPFSVRPVVGPHISSTDAISDTQIMLRWTYSPSSNNNTPIQGFYIYYRPTDSDNDSDYKRDGVEGNKQWHLIGQLQPETSYDIKMQCFNDGGESEYSNVMICETRARQVPGVAPEDPVTLPEPYLPAATMPPGGLLYLIVGCVLGVMVLILLVFIAMCLWRNRQQRAVHKYDPPGYLYQPAEMNCHVIEYATLPGSSHTNGYGHGSHLVPPGCHHVHHKLPNGMGLLNGSAGLCPSGHVHNGPLSHGTPEYDHTHSHHRHNGGGMYTALPQSESSDCMSCQNFCNNNRCYTKPNGTLSSGGLPIMHHVTPCTQDGLELVLLARVTPPPDSPSSQQHMGEQGGETGEELDEAQKAPPPSQHSCCQSVEQQHSLLEEEEEDVPYESSESQEDCWGSLDIPELERGARVAWVTMAGHAGDLVQPAAQEA